MVLLRNSKLNVIDFGSSSTCEEVINTAKLRFALGVDLYGLLKTDILITTLIVLTVPETASGLQG